MEVLNYVSNCTNSEIDTLINGLENIHIVNENVVTIENKKYDENIISIEKLEEPKESTEIEKIDNICLPPTKKRASVEYNCTELIVAILLINKNINNYKELLQKIEEMKTYNSSYENILYFNNKNDFIEYTKEIETKKRIINKFITNFRNSISDFPELNIENIKCIFISGKINKHEEIKELNKNLKKMEAKSDIYVKFIDNKIVGFSVKQSKSATKSNYSVQKMLGKEEDKNLTIIRKKYLQDNGIAKSDKSQRDKANSLFYFQNKENPYWIELKKQIKNKKNDITNELVKLLSCSKVNYDIYEYDGEKITKINNCNTCDTCNTNDTEIDFNEYIPYYFDKSNNERRTAKLFYRLKIHDKIYRVEIRWKGDIFNASPQFQIHEE